MREWRQGTGWSLSEVRSSTCQGKVKRRMNSTGTIGKAARARGRKGKSKVCQCPEFDCMLISPVSPKLCDSRGHRTHELAPKPKPNPNALSLSKHRAQSIIQSTPQFPTSQPRHTSRRTRARAHCCSVCGTECVARSHLRLLCRAGGGSRCSGVDRVVREAPLGQRGSLSQRFFRVEC